MEVPHLMRVRADRSAPPEDLKSGRFRDGKLTWFSWMRQPVVSPNGKTVAMVTDQPRPDERDVVVQLYNLKSGKFSRPDLPVTSPLGHQDPTWRPDGRSLLFVRNGREGATGAPVIYRYDVKEKASRPLTTGRLSRSVVVARPEVDRGHQTTAFGTDMVILDAKTGAEVLRVTNDGRSWAPVFSPAGDGIAFLHPTARSSTWSSRRSAARDRAGRWARRSRSRSCPASTRSRARLVHPRREAPGPADPHAAGPRLAFRVGLAPARHDRLPRAPRRPVGGVRHRPVPGYRSRPGGLPPGSPADLDGVERFARLLLEAGAPYAAAVKPNLAFFEAFGSAGLAALERIRAGVPGDIPVILDAKRGDIGSTAARQAAALYDALGRGRGHGEPVPRGGGDRPVAERVDRFAFVLCRTSNPGAAELQGLVVEADGPTGAPAEPLWARVARRVTAWGPGGTVGLVVGATAPDELRPGRAIAPGLAFLVPGVGAQGGEVEPVLAHGLATAAPAGGRPGGGLLVNVSRGVARAALGGRRERTTRSGARRGGRPRVGSNASLCYPNRRPRGSGPPRTPARWTAQMPNIGPVELIVILAIALIVIGPGKLPEVGGIARQEHPRVPQGRHRRQGLGQARRPAAAGSGRAGAAPADADSRCPRGRDAGRSPAAPPPAPAESARDAAHRVGPRMPPAPRRLAALGARPWLTRTRSTAASPCRRNPAVPPLRPAARRAGRGDHDAGRPPQPSSAAGCSGHPRRPRRDGRRFLVRRPDHRDS